MAQITVSWEAMGAAGHRIYYRVPADESWIFAAEVPHGVLEYTIHFLGDRILYDVGVSAWDGVTESPIVMLVADVEPVPEPDPVPPTPGPEPEPTPEPPTPTLRAKDLEVIAEGSGMYRVLVDGVQVSQHTSERKALKRALDEKLAQPEAEVFYEHDYLVRIEA